MPFRADAAVNLAEFLHCTANVAQTTGSEDHVLRRFPNRPELSA